VLGYGDKGIEIVYHGEEKKILYWADWSNQQNKNILYRLVKPIEPTKEGPISFVLFESPFTSVSTVSRQRPPLSGLLAGKSQVMVLKPITQVDQLVANAMEKRSNLAEKSSSVKEKMTQPFEKKSL
jgi:hypothetical protein